MDQFVKETFFSLSFPDLLNQTCQCKILKIKFQTPYWAGSGDSRSISSLNFCCGKSLNFIHYIFFFSCSTSSPPPPFFLSDCPLKKHWRVVLWLDRPVIPLDFYLTENQNLLFFGWLLNANTLLPLANPVLITSCFLCCPADNLDWFWL